MSEQALDSSTHVARSTPEMFVMLYRELRMLAAARLRREKPGHTLQATALVHEAVLRLLGSDENWHSRNHFYASAARAMRRVLIDSARKKRTVRHGGDWKSIDLCDGLLAQDYNHEQIIDLDDAIEELAELDASAARIVELRIFAGLTFQEIADLNSISQAKVYREWTFARAWLSTQLRNCNTTPC